MIFRHLLILGLSMITSGCVFEQQYTVVTRCRGLIFQAADIQESIRIRRIFHDVAIKTGHAFEDRTPYDYNSGSDTSAVVYTDHGQLSVHGFHPDAMKTRGGSVKYHVSWSMVSRNRSNISPEPCSNDGSVQFENLKALISENWTTIEDKRPPYVSGVSDKDGRHVNIKNFWKY